MNREYEARDDVEVSGSETPWMCVCGTVFSIPSAWTAWACQTCGRTHAREVSDEDDES